MELMTRIRAITTTAIPPRRKNSGVFAMCRSIVVRIFLLAAVCSGTVGGEASSASSDGLLFGEVVNDRGCDHCQVLVRSLRNPSAVQFDVVVESKAVSFLSAWGIDRRAICELVFLDEEHWFGLCDTYDFHFSSFEEWSDSRPKCRNCTTARRYVFGANTLECGARLLGVVKNPAQKAGIDLQAALELSEWDPEQISVLKKALSLVGANGCPRVSRELIEFFAIDTGSKLTQGDLEDASSVPDDVADLLTMEQLNGLTDWLEHAVDRIP